MMEFLAAVSNSAYGYLIEQFFVVEHPDMKTSNYYIIECMIERNLNISIEAFRNAAKQAGYKYKEIGKLPKKVKRRGVSYPTNVTWTLYIGPAVETYFLGECIDEIGFDCTE
jgi:hypothetical protein